MTNDPGITQTHLDGCFQIKLPLHTDARGHFVKSFHAPTLSAIGLHSHFEEDFFSVSRRNVLRGFHFVTPPLHGIKLLYVIQGQILDAILDLRPRSPTFGQHLCFELDAQHGDALYLAAGIAHAFLTISATATVGYKTEFAHNPAHDAGVRWNSTPVHWPTSDPILSDRDRALPTLEQLLNPFP